MRPERRRGGRRRPGPARRGPASRRSLVALGLAAAVLAVAAGPARAVVLSEDPLQETSTELGVIARMFSFVLTGPLLRPPYLPDDEDPQTFGVTDLRLYFVDKQPWFKLVVHDQLTAVVRSHPVVSALAFGRGLPPPRYLPLTFTAADDPTVTLASTADWLYAAVTRGPMTVTLGRQPISFGRGVVWSPMDLIGTFTLTEVDTEYKPGADAVRVNLTTSERTSLTVVASTGELEDDHDLDASLQGSAFLARGKWRIDDGELGALAGTVRNDMVAGVDAALDLGRFDGHGEVTVTVPTARSLSSPEAGAGDAVLKAEVGASFKPTSGLTLEPEALYNGFGSWQPDGYLAVARSQRVAIGEQITLGRLYAGGVADWEVYALLHLTGMALVNVRDPGALASVALRYNLADNVEGVLGGYLPVGRRPTAAAPLTARSEYGLFPYFVFLELKAAI